jgi:hypothetical protein
MSLGIINTDAMRVGVINQLIEEGVYPGFEDALADTATASRMNLLSRPHDQARWTRRRDCLFLSVRAAREGDLNRAGREGGFVGFRAGVPDNPLGIVASRHPTVARCRGRIRSLDKCARDGNGDVAVTSTPSY